MRPLDADRLSKVPPSGCVTPDFLALSYLLAAAPAPASSPPTFAKEAAKQLG